MPNGSDITFASGMKASEIGAWMRDVLIDGAVRFYERDGKNWDASMQEQHASFRTSVYSWYDREAADFAARCNCVKGLGVYPHGFLRYNMQYTVKSGHNDTTLGNSLVNSAIAYAAFKRLGVRVSILVNGDDLLVAAYKDYDHDAVVDLEAKFGITPEARSFTDPGHVSFVSGMFLVDGVSVGFVPLPGRLFSRLWWTVNPPGRRKRETYLRSVAKSLLPTCVDIPLVRVLLSKFDSVGDTMTTDKGYNYRGCEQRFTNRVWQALSDRYGIAVAELQALESWLMGLPAVPLYLRHDTLDKIIELDLADIGDRGVGIW
jgi:hypothetical protein